MLKQARIILSLIIVIALLLSLPACASYRGEINPPSSDNKGQHLPPPPPKTGNPKLGSLRDFVEAVKRGEAESYARQHGISLVDGGIEVEIYYVAGQLDAAAEAATRAGGKIVKLKSPIKNYMTNYFIAVVPITSLAALANEESILSIKVPVRPTPAASN